MIARVYKISIGFNRDSEKNIKASDYLLQCVDKIRTNIRVLIDEALSFDNSMDSYKLNELSRRFEPDCPDSESFIKVVETLKHDTNYVFMSPNLLQHIISNKPVDDELRYVEALCRAMCRLILKDMHYKEYDINITTI